MIKYKHIEKIKDDTYKIITISFNGGIAYVDVNGNFNPDIILTYEEGDTRYINLYLSNRKTENNSFAKKIRIGNKDKYGPLIISKINHSQNEKYAPYFDILVPKIGDIEINKKIKIK